MTGVKRMLDEPPAIAAKRNRLEKSVELLRQSKDVVSEIMDRVVADVDK
jgi:Dynamin GTPase effector domain